MLLNGKAKEDFEKFVIIFFRKERPDYINFSDESILKKYYRKTEIEKISIIIEWISLLEFHGKDFFKSCFRHHYSEKDIFKMKDIFKNSIISANNIYNDLKIYPCTR